MAASEPGGHAFQEQQGFIDDQFDIFDWYPYFQSCVRYFLEHAQFDGPVQALAAYLNIQLPFQRAQNALLRASPTPGVPEALGGIQHPGPGGPLSPAAAAAAAAAGAGYPPQPRHHYRAWQYQNISLHPYIRRLVATGFDAPAVLHGFFGDDWELGVRPLHEQERRNYLFAAKSGSWLEVKRAYDAAHGPAAGPFSFFPPPAAAAAVPLSAPPPPPPPLRPFSSSSWAAEDESVPFLRPLRRVTEAEIVAAEAGWSEWLAMQDWMLGPRAVGVSRGAGTSSTGSGGPVGIKREED
ncbi:hypothetical protein L209DRAFT_675484 [Thermothelomyces heterothallicus CBS 203.75]